MDVNERNLAQTHILKDAQPFIQQVISERSKEHQSMPPPTTARNEESVEKQVTASTSAGATASVAVLIEGANKSTLSAKVPSKPKQGSLMSLLKRMCNESVQASEVAKEKDNETLDINQELKDYMKFACESK
jgi:hypothetical protein